MLRRGEMTWTHAVDSALCETLAARAIAGDAEAYQKLVQYLWPIWIALIRSSTSMGALASSDDHVRNVATRLTAKVGRPDGHGLRMFSLWRERHPEKTFVDWNRIVARNAVRDYVREQLGARPADPDQPSKKRLLNEFSTSAVIDELGIRPPVTAVQTARDLLTFAESRLAPDQARVLQRWLLDASFEDIAIELGLTADEVRKVLRAAIAVLRRHFGRAT
jgi:DNA-directed RNA polymerase specialized sigma24 family protein